jgi:signal transduction histidine kinase
MSEPNESLRSRLFRIDTAILGVALAFIIAVQEAAFQDRFLLILYYLVAAGSAYALIHRRAFGYAATTIAVAGATVFAATYYAAKPDVWNPWLDSIRDLAGLGLLLYVTYRVLAELFRFQKEEKARELRQLAEQKMIQMRAAALRSTSHEVRAPLATITALSETLLDGSAGDLNEVQREFVQDIDDAAQHLLALVNDILDYAKAEAGMIKLMPEPVALIELVEQCVAMIQPKAEKAEVTVSTQVAPELKEIVADPLRLKQILLNLMSNAVKFSPAGGAVTVRIRPDGDHVLVSVRDTGRGIAPEHIAHLFDPYYQAAVADQSVGTGLGLAIIKHLTELQGGSVNVESVVGAGSVFRVRLPKVQRAATESPADSRQTRTTATGPSDEIQVASAL